jgi:hypothetical protein
MGRYFKAKGPVRSSWLIVLFFSVCGCLFAEMRMWTDPDGSRFAGEFSKELFGEALINDANGRQHFIKVEQLSKSDLDYIQYHVPPEVDINVKFETRQLPKTEWSREDDNTTLYTFTVMLRKTSEMPYRGQLTAELFVIADERVEIVKDDYVLMQRGREDFIFSQDSDNSYEFTVRDIPFESYRANWIEVANSVNRGKAYLGYILAVSDSQARVVAYKTDIRNHNWLTEDISRSVTELSKLYKDHRGSVESRHFDDSFRKIETPRVPWFRRTQKF